MKVTFTDYAECFGIDLTAETEAESMALVRFGLNKTKGLQYLVTNVAGNRASSHLVISKKKRNQTQI